MNNFYRRALLQSKRATAFTLAELLIVIAIIAVLIGILLPALSAARRSASSVKCLAALRDLGTAFQQYAQENRRMFPVVRWYPKSGWISATETPNTTDRVWIDFLSRYVHKRDTAGDPQKYAELQNTSVFWGCPAYNTELFQNVGTDMRRYSLSYGMSIYALAPYAVGAGVGIPNATPERDTSIGSGFLTGVNFAVLTGGAPGGLSPSPTGYGSGWGKFFKMEQWSRRSQDKALLADANGVDIIASPTWMKADEAAAGTAMNLQPKQMGLDYTATGNPALSGNAITVDSTRHAAPTASKKKVLSSKGINMLFVDGHAASVSPREAWIAARGAGIDLTQ